MSRAMSKVARTPPAEVDLYERDFYAWTRTQARNLARRDDAALDVSNLLEEVESLGRSQRNAIASRLEVLVAQLLKFRLQPERATPSWRRTLREQRRQIERLVVRNPSLRHLPREALPDLYPDAVRMAAAETRLAEVAFPRTYPFTIDQILDPGFEP